MPSQVPPKYREPALSLAAFALVFLSSFYPSTAIDAITPYQSLVDDGQTLTSPNGVFELGFFFTQNGTSKTRYVGVCYTNIPDKIAVWVANRGAPLTGSGGILNLTNDGNLSLYDPTGVVLWSTTTSNVRSPVVQLLDSGSLVLKDSDSNSNSFVWQSFDYPGNLMLPGMRLGWDLRANLGWYLTSWKTTTDPSPGPYSCKMDPRGPIRELYLWNGTEVMCRIGFWNGHDLSGLPPLVTEDYIKFSFTSNPDEVSFTFELINSSIVSLLLLTESGVLQRLVWLNEEWKVYLQYPTDQCDMYAECGRYGLCAPEGSTVTSCRCLKGFRPRSMEDWQLRDWSAGCERATGLNCSANGGDGFVKLSGLKLPETLNSTSLMSSMGLDECTDWCLKNCSCVAFAMISGEASGCITWFGDLVDIREITGAGDDLYLRLAASELDRKEANSNKKEHKVLVTIIVILGILFIILVALFLWKRKRLRGIKVDYHTNAISENELDLHLFDLCTLQSATNDFFIENKLGEGGFGQVYKGQLGDGQEIAVKRLSKESVQGLDEFKNEALLIAKLQHRNLVQLLGCCIQGDERMLVYGYMQNKSLDCFIFDKTKSASLDWQKRLDIILGIARGLLYLHQDSRFKIVHRDLKTSNILLDEEMNPKISDFGLARIFKGDQVQESTKRVIGTYGYMSPEYAMDGIFSVKSDVFSFGVLVLEILSGQKNRVTYGAEPNMNLLAHAWNLWMEDKCLELLDRTVQCSYPTSELLRCMQVGLLCVQEGRDDRPIMSSVVMMLSNEAMAIPQPKKPGFSIKRITMETECSCSDQHSSNEVTITMLQGR